MHTKSVGGESVTLHTAEAVKPNRPATPSVVMTETAPPNMAIALRKLPTSTMIVPLSYPARGFGFGS